MIKLSNALLKVGIDVKKKFFKEIYQSLGGYLRIVVVGGAPFSVEKEKGFIIADENCMTNIENVYACGDVIKKTVYQLTTAAGEGTIVANHIIKKNKK